MIYEIGILFGLLCLLLLLAQTAGALLCLPFSGLPVQCRFQNLTFHLFAGATALVMLTAMIYAKMQTVMILIIIPAIMIFWSKRKFLDFGNLKDLNTIFGWRNLLLIAVLAIIGLISGLLVEYSSILNNDIVFYSKVAHWMSITGIENTFHHYNETEPAFRGTLPYHYFELWLAAGSSEIYGSLPTVFHLKYLVYGFFKVYFFVGIFAIIKQIKPSVHPSFLLVPIIVSFIPFGFLDDYLPLVSQFNASAWGRPNYLIYFFVLIPVVIHLLNRRRAIALYVLLFLPIATITALPSFAPAFLLICLIWLWKKNLERIEALQLFATGVFVFLGSALFYVFTGAKVNAVQIDLQDILSNISLLWKSIAGQVIFTAIAFGLPTIIIGLAIKRLADFEKFAPVFMLFGILLLMGLLAFQGLVGIDNSYQFVYPAYALFYVGLLATVCLAAAKWRIVAVILICAGLFYGVKLSLNDDHHKILLGSASLANYHLQLRGLSEAEVNDLHTRLPGLRVGLFDVDEVFMKTIRPKHRHFLTLPVPNYLHYINPDIRLYPIVAPEVMYGTPIDTVTFAKAYHFNKEVQFYKDNLSVAEYSKIVQADFAVRSYLVPGRDDPGLEWIDLSTHELSD